MRTDLECAVHHEGACSVLLGNGDYPEWVIITAFYAALHYANHLLFPRSVENRDGSEVVVDTVDDYVRVARPGIGRHLVRVQLLEQNNGIIGGVYRDLWDLSEAARYGTNEVTGLEVEHAIQCLNEIKDHCTSEVVETQEDDHEEGPT